MSRKRCKQEPAEKELIPYGPYDDKLVTESQYIEYEVDRDYNVMMEMFGQATYLDTLNKYYKIFIDLALKEGFIPPPKFINFLGHDIEPIIINIKINPLYNNEEIEAEIDALKRVVIEIADIKREKLPEHLKILLVNFYIKNKKEKIKTNEELDKVLSMAVDCYNAYKSSGTYFGAAIKLGLISDTKNVNECNRCEKKVARYYDLAKRYIEATAKGTFLEELAKQEPMK